MLIGLIHQNTSRLKDKIRWNVAIAVCFLLTVRALQAAGIHRCGVILNSRDRFS
jgi:hypothetical protein